MSVFSSNHIALGILMSIGALISAGCTHTASLTCPENLEHGAVYLKSAVAGAASGADRPSSMGFSIFESSVSGNSFTIGALIRNRSQYHYAFKKSEAKLYLMRAAQGPLSGSVPYRTENRVASVNIEITAWEDGDSPALRLLPCQEKWIRFRGTIENEQAKKLLGLNEVQASIFVFRLVSLGWQASPSDTFFLSSPDFLDAIKQFCKDTPGCGK